MFFKTVKFPPIPGNRGKVVVKLAKGGGKKTTLIGGRARRRGVKVGPPLPPCPFFDLPFGKMNTETRAALGGVNRRGKHSF